MGGNSTVDCRALAGISFIRAARFLFFSLPHFSTNQKQTNLFWTRHLKSCSVRKRGQQARHVCAGVEVSTHTHTHTHIYMNIYTPSPESLSPYWFKNANRIWPQDVFISAAWFWQPPAANFQLSPFPFSLFPFPSAFLSSSAINGN